MTASQISYWSGVLSLIFRWVEARTTPVLAPERTSWDSSSQFQRRKGWCKRHGLLYIWCICPLYFANQFRNLWYWLCKTRKNMRTHKRDESYASGITKKKERGAGGFLHPRKFFVLILYYITSLTLISRKPSSKLDAKKKPEVWSKLILDVFNKCRCL